MEREKVAEIDKAPSIDNLSVGVVTRTKNRAILLTRALESILSQTHQNWHLSLVNDGGAPDPVNELVLRYKERLSDRITITHNRASVGRGGAVNIGLSKLRTDYAVVHDDDDSWTPHFMEHCLKTLLMQQQKYPSIRGIVCQIDMVYEAFTDSLIKTSYVKPWNDSRQSGPVSLDNMLYNNTFAPISFIFPLQIGKELNGHGESFPVAGDWEFNVKFLMKYDIWRSSETHAFYHHRLDADGDMGNSVIFGSPRQLAYHTLLLNQWLRSDLSDKSSGVGTYINYRAHLQSLSEIQRSLAGMQSSLTGIEGSLAGMQKSLATIENFILRSKRALRPFARILRPGFRLALALKRIASNIIVRSNGRPA